MSASVRRHRGLRRRDALHAHSLHFGPNMTPMVDVVMVILIFFMASAAFLGSEWFLKAAIPFDAGRGSNRNKPNDPTALPPVRLDLLMDVNEAGQTVVTFPPLTRAPVDAFFARIAEFKKDQTAGDIEIVIRPTPRVPYADVVRVHAACDDAGIYKLGISVTRPAATAPTPQP
jgi:biopolymer transport protein ExbD